MDDILIAPDAYDRLVENYIRIARENAELREETIISSRQ